MSLSTNDKLKQLTRTSLKFSFEIVDLAAIMTIMDSLGYPCALNSNNMIVRAALESVVKAKIDDGTVPERTYDEARAYIDKLRTGDSPINSLDLPQLQSQPRKKTLGNEPLIESIAEALTPAIEAPPLSESNLFKGGSFDGVPEISEDELSSNRKKSQKKEKLDDKDHSYRQKE